LNSDLKLAVESAEEDQMKIREMDRIESLERAIESLQSIKLKKSNPAK
jgi:hypothetical protein